MIMQNEVVAVTVMALERMSNEIVAAASNGLRAFGKVSSVNIAYKSTLNANLIKEDGSPVDKEELPKALEFEVLRRFW